MKNKKITIYTIGHSTRSFEEFVEILQHYGITHVIDIRTMTGSRYNPAYNEDEFKKALKHKNIQYNSLKELGGLRHPSKDSINTAWRNKSFRGYADYMQTEEFKKGIDKLLKYARQDTIVIMCAEAVPWRCHRSLVGDALLVRNVQVEDIFSLTSCKPHTLTPWAVVKGLTITYPSK